ncbi:MAG: hypothetical protein ACRCTY_01110 [Candidatus Adiutrix sp.]
MKLFDLKPFEAQEIRSLALWHLAYIFLVALFFAFIYYFGYFKTTKFLKESALFIYVSPISTLIFVFISPWRRAWLAAIVGTYERLEGDFIFCFMASLVFLMGFYFYSILLWGLGALGPSIFYI